MIYTGNGKVLIAWDMGCGPTWAYDPLGKPIKEKYLGTCEVWRSNGRTAVNLGETSAEAFLDDQVGDLKAMAYWVMENVKGGGQRQIGPVMDVVVPPARLEPDLTPPSPPNELRCRLRSGGNELSWLPSVDDESGVLAYLVYSANDRQPDAVLWVNEEDPLDRPAYGEGTDPSEEEAALGQTDPVWELDENGDPIIDEWGNRVAKERARITWLDRTPDRKKPYVIRAIDNALNLSEPTGRVDPWTGEPAGTLNPDGAPKAREPVEPVTPEAGGVIIGDWYEQILQTVEGETVTQATAGRRSSPSNFTQYLDGPLADSLWSDPAQMKRDSKGNLFVNDMYAGTVRMITPEGIVSTIAGSPFHWGFVDGAGAAARFTYVYALGIDDDDVLYVGDQTNYTIRRLSGTVEEGWTVSTFFGKPGWSGCVDGHGIAVDVPIVGSSATTYVAGRGYKRTITTSIPHNFVTGDTVAIWGLTPTTWPTPNTTDTIIEVLNGTQFDYYLSPGPGTARTGGTCFLRDSAIPNDPRPFCNIDYPQGIAVASSGDIYFTQRGNVVRRLTQSGYLTTIAGDYYSAGSTDGAGTEARFNGICDLVCVRNDDPEQEYLLVADGENHTIRKVMLDGTTSTYLGVPAPWPELPTDVDGPASVARLSYPCILCLDGDDLWIGESGYTEDTYDHYGKVRIFSGGVLTSVAGCIPPTLPYHDGEGAGASIAAIGGMALL